MKKKEIEDKISIFEKVWTNHLSQAKEPVSEKFLESGYDIVKQSMSLSNGDSKLIIAGFTIAKFLKPDNKHRDIQGMAISYAVKILENYSENFESETIPLFRISMSTLYKIITTGQGDISKHKSRILDIFSKIMLRYHSKKSVPCARRTGNVFGSFTPYRKQVGVYFCRVLKY